MGYQAYNAAELKVSFGHLGIVTPAVFAKVPKEFKFLGLWLIARGNKGGKRI